MSQQTLTARIRQGTGKGLARKLRRQKQIPAVFYGPNAQAVMLAVDYPELERVITHAASENIILDLEVVSDGGKETKRAILKELQIDPVKDVYLHADFYEISMDKEITVDIAIHLINTPVGVTNGGILQHVRRELTISCLPDKIIDALELDVSGLDIGDALHVSDIPLPEGISTEEDGHLTVAVVAAPTVEPEVAEAEEEGVEEEAAEEEAEPEEEASEE